MRFLIPASSILCVACLLLMAGCESLGIPNHLARKDEVPPEVKAQPLTVQVPPAQASYEGMPWPRLGDVPFMPKDFSPPPVYNHYMNEMEFQRDSAEAAKQKAEATDPLIAPAGGLTPPQLPQKE